MVTSGVLLENKPALTRRKERKRRRKRREEKSQTRANLNGGELDGEKQGQANINGAELDFETSKFFFSCIAGRVRDIVGQLLEF